MSKHLTIKHLNLTFFKGKYSIGIYMISLSLLLLSLCEITFRKNIKVNAHYCNTNKFKHLHFMFIAYTTTELTENQYNDDDLLSIL